MLTPTGLLAPYRASRVIPATIVGRANGRSIRALTTRLPGNWSRTRTQAISVPIPAFPAATSSDTIRVKRSAATAWGSVAAAQKAAQPSRLERHTTAVSGRTTIRLRYRVTVPRSSAAPPRTSRPIRRRVTTLVANRDADLVLDVGHDPGLFVEEPLVHLGPSAQVLDGEQPRRRGELGGCRDLLVDRAVALLDEDLLGLGRQQVVEERLGLRRVLALGGDRDRVLDQDRLIGHHVVDVLLLLLGSDGLVLVGDHDVALAPDKGLQGLTGRLVLHRHVAEQLLQIGHRLLGRLALLELGAVGRHDVPAGPTGGERVGGDDLDPRLDQVIPGPNVLGVALTGDQDHHRVGDHALVGVGVPVLGDQAGVDQLGHVRLQRQRHHVGGQAAFHGPGLVAGAAVGLADADALASIGLLEARDERLIGLPGGRVGDQRQLVAPAARPTATGGQQHPRGQQAAGELDADLHRSSNRDYHFPYLIDGE